MTTDDTTGSIRVINEEYDRVLSNPDNLIMSESLQELMDLPMEPPDSEPEALIDTLVITIIDDDGLGVTVRGNLSGISQDSQQGYTITVDTEKIRQEFLSTLEKYLRRDEGGPLVIGGTYNSEIPEADITSWSTERSEPHTVRLKIDFRSEDVIF